MTTAHSSNEGVIQSQAGLMVDDSCIVTLRIRLGKDVIVKASQWHCTINRDEQSLSFVNVLSEHEYNVDLTSSKLKKIKRNQYELQQEELTFELTPEGKQRKYHQQFQTLMKIIQDIIGRFNNSLAAKAKQTREFAEMIRKTEDVDKRLRQHLRECGMTKMSSSSKKILEKGYSLRNEFWILLRETAALLKQDENDAFQICANLEEWPDLATMNELKIPERDYDIMNKGYKLMKRITEDEDRQSQRKNLKQKWEKWIKDMDKLEPKLRNLSADGQRGYNIKMIIGSLVAVAGVAIITVATFYVSIPELVAVGELAVAFGRNMAEKAYKDKKAWQEYEQSKSLQNFISSLQSMKDDALKFEFWLQELIAIDRCKGIVHEIHDSNGELIRRFRDGKKRYIAKIKEEFEEWMKACKDANKQVRNIQKRIANIH